MRQRRRLAVLALGCVLGLASTPLAAIDVVGISITSGPFRVDGGSLDYRLTFEVQGTQMIGGRVVKPGPPLIELCQLEFSGPGLLSDETWACELEGFASLLEICQDVGFGSFGFELTAAAGPNDSVTLSFDPGCTDPFGGHPAITAPASGGTVSPMPDADDFCWTCSQAGACGPSSYAAFIADPAGDVFGELLRGDPLPTCWSPAICLPQGTNYEFAAAVEQFQSDHVPSLTVAGDPFVFASAFESANATQFSVTTSPPTTPPAVPEGRGATGPVLARKLTANGSSLEVRWDVRSCCAAQNHHLIWGRRPELPAAPGGTFGIAGSRCLLGTTGVFTWTGTPTVSSGDMVWWLVLADGGAGIEGSWGGDGQGAERAGPGPGGASQACGFAAKNATNACGR